MAQQEEIVLWIDQRWKNAIEKHLRDETLQEHLENVLDELCNQLPEREYARISRAIQSEAAAPRSPYRHLELCGIAQDKITEKRRGGGQKPPFAAAFVSNLLKFETFYEKGLTEQRVGI